MVSDCRKFLTFGSYYSTSACFLPVREHFSSPLLQFAEADAGQTFTLVECPSESNKIRTILFAIEDPWLSGGTGQLISRLSTNVIDIAMYALSYKGMV